MLAPTFVLVSVVEHIELAPGETWTDPFKMVDAMVTEVRKFFKNISGPSPRVSLGDTSHGVRSQ